MLLLKWRCGQVHSEAAESDTEPVCSLFPVFLVRRFGHTGEFTTCVHSDLKTRKSAYSDLKHFPACSDVTAENIAVINLTGLRKLKFLIINCSSFACWIFLNFDGCSSPEAWSQLRWSTGPIPKALLRTNHCFNCFYMFNTKQVQVLMFLKTT